MPHVRRFEDTEEMLEDSKAVVANVRESLLEYEDKK